MFPISPCTAHHVLTTMCCASYPVRLQPREVLTITQHHVATDAAQTPSMNPGQFTPAAAEAVCLTHVMYNVDRHPDYLKDLLREVGHHHSPPRHEKLLLLLPPSHPVPPLEARWSNLSQKPTTAHPHCTTLMSLQ